MFKINPKVTSDELGLGLWELIEQVSKRFYNEIHPKLEELGIKFDKEGDFNLSREIVIINLWAVSKVLAPDKKALDSIHKIYILRHRNMAEKESEKRGAAEDAQLHLLARYERYYKLWDDKDSGNQFILGGDMLESMIGKDTRVTMNAFLINTLIMHVVVVMKMALSYRSGLGVSNSAS